MILFVDGAASHGGSEILQTASSIAQVILAACAIGYSIYAGVRSLRATKQATKDSVFIGHVVKTLMDLVMSARAVRSAYRSMFIKYADAEEKAKARMAWLRQREDVTVSLNDLAELLPEIVPARDAWRVVEREEDTFATSDTLVLPKVESIDAAYARYDLEHDKFVKKTAEILRALR